MSSVSCLWTVAFIAVYVLAFGSSPMFSTSLFVVVLALRCCLKSCLAFVGILEYLGYLVTGIVATRTM